MAQSNKKKVLLIGWDAADWKFINPLLDDGQLPNLSRLVDSGVIANLASLKPTLSPILWTSIATGKSADKHGILGFVEPSAEGGLQLSSSTSRKTKAVWNILSQSGYRSIVVNWYASHPAEPINGCVISNRFFEGLPPNLNAEWKMIPASVHPKSLSDIVSSFRMHPSELTVDDLRRFLPQLELIDFSSDKRPSLLAQELAKTVSIHSVATGAMQAEEWDFMAIYYDGIDTIGHHFMPYHPPRLDHIDEHDFEIYQHVMRECYRFHDEMLGRLLDLAGDETTVILLSDHGFHSDHLRPGQSLDGCSEEALAAAWHRHYGILAMRGEAVRKDERIYGATLLDITPTVLSLFGLPVGLDMDGKPLIQAFLANPELETIESWDAIEGESGLHPPDTKRVMTESREAIAQLVALGYLSSTALETDNSVSMARNESKFNLAIVYSSSGRHSQALEILADLNRENPQNSRYKLALAKTYANMGQHQQCLELIDQLEADGHASADTEMLAAAELYNSGQLGEAKRRLTSIEDRYPLNPYFYLLLGSIHVRRSNLEEAKNAFSKSVQLDNDDPHAHFHLASVLNQMGSFEEAADHAIEAIGRLYFFPQAHLQLGIAFRALGDFQRAIRSLEIAVSQSPNLLAAHQELADIYDRLNHSSLWLKHQRLAKGLPLDQ